MDVCVCVCVNCPQVESKDNIPSSFDLLQLVHLKEGERRPFLENILQACVSDAVPAFIDKYLERIKGLEARVTDAICATGPTTILATERR